MKRFISMVIALMLILSMCACAANNDADDIVVEETVAESLPTPTTVTYEKSDNKLGARYTFTLLEFNTMLNSASKQLQDDSESNKEAFDFDNWEIISKKLKDDNGVEYSSYYYATDTLTITAAVENKSKKVMNLGCGTTYNEFVNGDVDFQNTVMITSAIIAMVAGGYDESALQFLYNIFYESAKNSEQFYYENSVYMMNLSSSNDENQTVVLFMTSPCQDEILSEWGLTNYAEFESSASVE